MKKAYISGPIKDTPDFKDNFANGVRIMKIEGYETVNPCDLGEEDFTYEQYMRVDLMAMLDCDAIFMLAGWERSAGARCEHLVACMTGMNIFYQTPRA